MSRCNGLPGDLTRKRLRDTRKSGSYQKREDGEAISRQALPTDSHSPRNRRRNHVAKQLDDESDESANDSKGNSIVNIDGGDEYDGPADEEDEPVGDDPDGRRGHRRNKPKALSPKRSRKHIEYAEPVQWSIWEVFFVGVFIGLVVLVLLEYSKTSASSPYSLSPGQFTANVADLSLKFPSQPALTWKMFSGRGARHVEDATPVQPAIFLLAAYPAAHETMACLARRLARTFSNHSDVRVQSSAIAGRANGNGEVAKEMLKSDLDSILSAQSDVSEPRSPPVVLVEGLEELPPPSPFLFFSYCDSADSNDPSAVYIFTLRLPAADEQLDERAKPGAVAAMDFLASDVWREDRHKDYRAGSIEALITRVSDVAVLVRQEPEAALSSFCASI